MSFDTVPSEEDDGRCFLVVNLMTRRLETFVRQCRNCILVGHFDVKHVNTHDRIFEYGTFFDRTFTSPWKVGIGTRLTPSLRLVPD